jgi:hypothetical protein
LEPAARSPPSQPRVANEDAANNKRLAVIHKMEPQGSTTLRKIILMFVGFVNITTIVALAAPIAQLREW